MIILLRFLLPLVTMGPAALATHSEELMVMRLGADAESGALEHTGRRGR